VGIEQDKLRAPERLNSSHRIESFDSGNSQLDDWLKRRALKNEADNASRTYVLCSGDAVIGYYCLANGAIAQSTAIGRVRRNMPDPIPVMVIGRLAVDRQWQSRGIGQALLRDARGIGQALLRDAVLRTLQAAEIAGIRAILVHAISEDAKRFYEKHGFTASSLDPMTLMVKVSDAIESMGA
jgi:GNAT superfamily N-acetyltransferase